MLFTSYEFLLFLLIVFLLYYVMPERFQWKILLVASYIFYFASGAENLCYILFTTASTYLIVRKIQTCKDVQEAWLKEHKKEISREEKSSISKKRKRNSGDFCCSVFF